jgi:hypothetical protein
LAPAAAIAGEDFSQPIKQLNGQEGFHFGVAGSRIGQGNKGRIIGALRRLADDMEAGGTHVIGMRLATEAKPEDFLKHTLSIDFALDVPTS